MIWPIAGGIAQLKGGAVTGSAWSTTNRNSYASLSNGNYYLASNDSAQQYPGVAAGVRTRNSGRLYYEIQANTIPQAGFTSGGISVTPWTSFTGTIGSASDPNSPSFGLNVNASLYNWMINSGGGTAASFPGTSAGGDTLRIAVDFNISGSTGLYFGVNSIWSCGGSMSSTFLPGQADTYFPTGNILVPSGSAPYGASFVLVTGPVPLQSLSFVYAPPAGFVAWG